jgi:MFS family permease
MPQTDFLKDLLNKIENMFFKIFHKNVRFHTAIFVILNIILFAVFMVGQREDVKENISDLVVIFTLIFILGYLLLFLFSGNKTVSENLFKPKNYSFILLLTIIAFGISAGLVIAYRNALSPNLSVDIFRFDPLFPIILTIIFFGWNIVQIFYVRVSLKKWGEKSEEMYKSITRKTSLTDKKKETLIYIVNLLIILLSLLILLGASLAFKNSTNDAFQEDLNENNYENAILPLHPANTGMNIIIFVMTIVLIFTAYLEFTLFLEAKRNGKSNIYTGVFYLLFWIIVVIKMIILLNAYVNISEANENTGIDTERLDAFNIIADIILMLITIFNLLRKFGSKIELRGDGKKGKILNEYNVSYVMFLFVLSYFGGQYTILSADTFSNKAQLTFAVNLMVIIVNIGFYYYYSEYDLEQIGYIRKTRYTRPEVKNILLGLSNSIYDGLESSINSENDEIILESLNGYLLENEIILKEGTGINGEYLSLEGDEIKPKEEPKVVSEVEPEVELVKELDDDSEVESKKKPIDVHEEELDEKPEDLPEEMPEKKSEEKPEAESEEKPEAESEEKPEAESEEQSEEDSGEIPKE